MACQTVAHLLQVLHNGDVQTGIVWSVARWQPRADIYETAEAVLVHVEAPGLDEEHLRLRFEPGQLIIEGTRACPVLDTPRHCVQVEIEYGPFRRALPLPPDADGEAIEARYEAGVLFIQVPRKKASPPTNMRVNID